MTANYNKFFDALPLKFYNIQILKIKYFFDSLCCGNTTMYLINEQPRLLIFCFPARNFSWGLPKPPTVSTYLGTYLL